MIFSKHLPGKFEYQTSKIVLHKTCLTSHLSHNNVKVLDHTIWCLTHCAEAEDNRRRIRITGAIPLLLSLLENG